MSLRIAFFGTPDIAVTALNALEAHNLSPALVVTNPDAPAGRKQQLTPPPVKTWAQERDIKVLQPTHIPRTKEADSEFTAELSEARFDAFVVVAYGHILPRWLLALPKYGTINLHPSLLPKLRGPSPIRSAILYDQPDAVGVSIMLMDEEMDHGPLIVQSPGEIDPAAWPIGGAQLDEQLAHQGGTLLADTLPQWCRGELLAGTQDHAAATYCQKITKEMGELPLDPFDLPTGEAARDMLCTIRALEGWPETFFWHDGTRVKIKGAQLVDADGIDQLRPTRVVPAGKREIDFSAWLKTVSPN